MRKVVAIKLCLKIVLLSLLFSGCISSNVSESEDEKALRVIEKDIDDFRADLRALERVRGEPLDREVFIALDDAKQAVKRKDYEGVLDHYWDALRFVRGHMADESVVEQYLQSMQEVAGRLDNKDLAVDAYKIILPLIVKARLQRIIIPEFSFKPPATLIDAVDYFKQASSDYDDPDLPIQERGVSFMLKIGSCHDGDKFEIEGDDPFSSSEPSSSGVPVIPSISARFISMYDALKLVCDVTGYEFELSGGFVMIRPFGECDEDDGPDFFEDSEIVDRESEF